MCVLRVLCILDRDSAWQRSTCAGRLRYLHVCNGTKAKCSKFGTGSGHAFMAFSSKWRPTAWKTTCGRMELPHETRQDQLLRCHKLNIDTHNCRRILTVLPRQPGKRCSLGVQVALANLTRPYDATYSNAIDRLTLCRPNGEDSKGLANGPYSGSRAEMLTPPGCRRIRRRGRS